MQSLIWLGWGLGLCLLLGEDLLDVFVIEDHLVLLKIQMLRGLHLLLLQEVLGADDDSLWSRLGRSDLPGFSWSHRSLLLIMRIGSVKASLSLLLLLLEGLLLRILQERDIVMSIQTSRSSNESVLINIQLLGKVIIFSVLLKLFLWLDKYLPEIPKILKLVPISQLGKVLNSRDLLLKIKPLSLASDHSFLDLILSWLLHIMFPLLTQTHQLDRIQNEILFDVLIKRRINCETRSVVNLGYEVSTSRITGLRWWSSIRSNPST